ncbi:MAG: Ppx/GppA family phosphatase [Bacteroidales bacterium]|nr:Ppx/GppA family phosphatase [Bacteroidales bacterium]
MIFAAIDIGSNASRLLFANVFETGKKILVEKATLVRIPTRLGEDVYSISRISDEKSDNLIKTLKAFKLLLEVYNPVCFDVCATAAMREAKNSENILQRINSEAGIDVRIIDGIEEANIIRKTNRIVFDSNERPVIFIDVGGGSTDISIIHNNKVLAVKSFKIGTLRYLAGKIPETEWKDLSDWLGRFRKDFGNFNIIGSGGNINKINKIYGDPENFQLTYKLLKHAYEHLSSFSLEERIVKLGLRPDRADVIIPAARIFIFILKIIKARYIYVPKIGLADGLVHQLYKKYKKEQKR